MDIIKAFSSNNLNINITIKGTYLNPLFRASDIGLVLDIKQISSTIRDYDTSQKVAHIIPTNGGNQEVSFLTVFGLYELLFTSRKIIAKEFKKWVCEVLEELRVNGKYELENKLLEKNEEIKKIKKISEEIIYNKNEELAKFQKRNKVKYDKKDRVYVYEDTSNDGTLVYKIGYSANMKERTETYDICRFENKLKFELICNNGRVLESTVHQILNTKQDCEKKEWFHTSLDIIKNVIIFAKFILDDFINDTITQDEILNKITEFNNFFKINTNLDEIQISNEIINLDIIDNKYVDKDEKYIKFFNDCCIFDETYEAVSADLYAVYRKWNKGCSKIERTELLDYVKKTYKFKKICNELTKKNEAGFRGFKIIDNGYQVTGEPTIYDNYIIENCHVNVISRTSLYSITKDFTLWIKNKNINEKQVLHEFRKHLLDNFTICRGTFIYNGKKESNGLYGICLNSEIESNSKFSTANKSKKKVYKIDPKTNNIVDTYESLIVTSNTLKNDMYHRVKNKIIYTDGFLYTYDIPN
jgi:prophage antirepressor-like protein